MIVALWAALAMGAKDLLGSMMVVAESRNRGWLAGSLDVLGDLCTLLTFGIGIETAVAHGWSTVTVVTIVCMSASSLIATKVGTSWATKLTS